MDSPDYPIGTAYYPANLRDGANLRVGGSETLRNWFRRIIGEDEPIDRILDCALEDNFAFFGKVTWRDGVIIEGSFQALIIKDTDLLRYFTEDNHDAQYYRFDIHPQQTGRLFAEPHPHIHCVPDGAPRFHFCWENRGSCILSFLEFVYRNHIYEKWLNWVKAVSSNSITADQMDEIIGAFDNGKIHEQFDEFGPLLTRLSNTLRQHKAALVNRPLTLSPMCAAISY